MNSLRTAITKLSNEKFKIPRIRIYRYVTLCRSKSVPLINYTPVDVRIFFPIPESKIERKHYAVSPLTYNTKQTFAPRLDFKEIRRRFRTEDYVARQTCLEWIHGRGKYRNLDTPVCILIYSVPGFRDFSFLERRGEARRATIYTRLSGWANKVPYIGYDGGRCREHNGSRRSPPPLVGFLRKLTILFRERVERRLYEKRSSPLDISIVRERERDPSTKSFLEISRDYIYRELNLYLSDNKNEFTCLLICQHGYTFARDIWNGNMVVVVGRGR